ncbi:hypothetical protein [Roseiflexus castenholzii]|uniref:RnfC Barrel sandwich hybrid domain-containing protein n=1 Tax=Roseiflexus castenholzii (strain DSM 13941 / HLO8) TaxID=383372 RepID=A7NIR8_ROSCS|nr:hypothetical protein [Roseiflexus castenholzii]ABU57371.1 conserved hypothetical protein [Roseiflexus castenholzii DSM 13941]
MSLYVPSGASPLVTGALARIERRLPHPGEITVRVGQRVEPDTPVALAYIPAAPRIINLARILTIPPARVKRSLLHDIGAPIAQGAPLAQTGRFGKKKVLSPVSGVLASVDEATGYIAIVPDPERYELTANVPGVVMEIIPYEGVRIETPAAQVYGIFGIGASQYGVLQLMVTDPAEPITPDKINARFAYTIIIGGSTISATALQRAVQERVRGIIVGGIDEAELRAFLGVEGYAPWDVGPPHWRAPSSPHPAADLVLMVTEGFGNHPMSRPLFDLLASYAGKEALIEGTTHIWTDMRRPRVVIPLTTRAAGMPIDAPRPTVRPGAFVRVLHQPRLGQSGQVRTLSPAPQRLPSRVRAPAAEVVLEDGTITRVSAVAVEALN